MEIVFTRHGQSEANLAGIVQGRGDYPLTEKGRDQARRAATSLMEFKPYRVYSSPLMRALETAEIINRRHNSEIEIIDDLVEYDLGEFEGLTPEEIETRFPHVPEQMKKGVPFHMLAPGAETDEQAQARATRALDHALGSGLPRVIVVAHLGILERLITVFAQQYHIKNFDLDQVRPLKNCSISKFQTTIARAHAIIVNDVSHLE